MRSRRAMACVLLVAAFAVACDDRPDLSGRSFEELVELLGDPDYPTREAAQAELMRRGPDNLLRLLALLDHPDAEVRARVSKIASESGFKTARELVSWWRGLRRIRAVLPELPRPGGATGGGIAGIALMPLLERLERMVAEADAAHDRETDAARRAVLWDIQSALVGLHLDIGFLDSGTFPDVDRRMRAVAADIDKACDRIAEVVDGYGDLDQDTMPAPWELENGLNPLRNDADEDPDGDGVTNLQEHGRGTDPQTPD